MAIKMQQKCWPTTAISNPVIDGIGHEQCNIFVPDHVVTLAQDGTSPNMGWPNKELTTLSLLRPKIP